MDQAQAGENSSGGCARVIRSRVALFSIAAYLLFAAGALRMLLMFFDGPYRWYMIGLLAAYLLLLSTERSISTRWAAYQSIYFGLQIIVVTGLAVIQPKYDYYAILFPALCIQAIFFAPQKVAIFWVSMIIVAIVISELYLFGIPDGISYSLTYIAAGFFISIFSITTIRAEKAREKSQALLIELQAANKRLRVYADQVEELSTAQERSRLARELHDSVTQTIFSMTLTAESALILLDREPERVRDQLKHLQSLSKSALAEMRSLIQQMHPRTLAEEGLVSTLHRHVRERQQKDGLSVELRVLCQDDPPPHLPLEIEECLFRVIQEALNNVVKHARTDRASVTLDLREDPISAMIEDQGIGFDLRKTSGVSGHYGLIGMEDRVHALGGQLRIESLPGAGTRIHIVGLRLAPAGV